MVLQVTKPESILTGFRKAPKDFYLAAKLATLLSGAECYRSNSMFKKKNLLVAAISAVAVFYAYKCAKNGHDFEVFLQAGHKLIHGLNIYKPPFVQDLNYYYSPLFALLLAPFSNLPIIVPQLAWVFLSYFFLYRIWKLSVAYFDLVQLTERQKQWWLIITLFFAIRFILIDLRCVQMTIFLLWATLQSLDLIKRNKNIGGAALLALAINIKLLPIAFVCYLAYRKKLTAVFLICIFYGIYLYLPAIYLGWARNASLLSDWFATINPSNKEWTIEAENGPSSLVALVPVYLTDTVGVLSFKRNFLNLSLDQATLILNVVRLFFVGLTLFFLRTMPFKSVNSNIRQFWEMSYLFIVTPLIFPHQQIYAFVYIIPAFIYLSWYLVVNWAEIKAKMNVLSWVLLGIVAFNFSPLVGRDIITSRVYEVLLYLRILPMAVILLIPLLWICRPKNSMNVDS